MEKFKRTLIAGTVGMMAFFALLGVVGDHDYCEQIILSMTQEEYDSVKQHLEQLHGHSPSESDIAHWWADNHHNLP